MQLESIIYKAIFIFTIIMASISIFIKTESINELINISTIPMFMFNILLIINSINEVIRKIAEERKQYFKQFENDFSISKKDRLNKINDEIIYDEIRNLSEEQINRFLSTILVIIIVIEIVFICFKENFYEILRVYNFNVISLLSTSILIIDIYYKEKIATKIIEKIYKNKKQRNNKY